jgi:uncharacterized protein with NAD-binding domain and iron-sulfur cluster
VSRGLTRRQALGQAAAAGAALALPSGAWAGRRRPRAKNGTVAVYGAGMAGLAAAHELAERGFDVHVFERRAQLGGKARSFPVPGSGSGGRAPLPAEHGFRFFPGFYENVPDSMQRIPRPGRDNVMSSLRDLQSLSSDADGFGVALTNAAHRGLALSTNPDRLSDPGYLVGQLAGALAVLTGIPAVREPAELADFAQKCLVYMTSSIERRRGQWDHVAWWDFIGAPHKSAWFQQNIARGTTEALVAVKPEVCAVSSAGNIIDAFGWNIMGLGANERTAFLLRFLDGPTSEVWLDPWIRHLKSLGVTFHRNQALRSLAVHKGRITSAVVRSSSGRHRRVEADWHIAALPIDKALPVLTRRNVLAADEHLEGLRDLKTDWMNGLQIYLTRATSGPGVFATLDHPWTLSAVAQSQLWRRSIPQQYGDGTVRECISVDISTWDDGRGTTVAGRAARDCTREEVFREVWETFKDRWGGEEPALRDEHLHSWYLDPAIDTSGPRTTNDEPLTVQTVGTWDKRPAGPTGIPNLFVAGDWTQTNANVCCMEGGNWAGRTVARAVIEASGARTSEVDRWDYYTPPQLDDIKRQDAERYARGEPNLFDTGAPGAAALGDLQAVVGQAVARVRNRR